ncbi:uncharacterized protein LOC117317312 [Pecten maximus]|uniref:uncharacterized protein LOC117317312 n=1 Tax=Pecten maximus TaxID=6579 RepID=UPI001458C020|nr:uncharacterized protein LOC117317312 [Pecten maximus]
MDSTNITSDFLANEIPTPVLEVSCQDSTSALAIHQAVMEIIPDRTSSSIAATHLSSAEILQSIGTGGFPQQSSSSNVTISSLHKSTERDIGHELVSKSIASVLKPGLSPPSKTSWSVSSMIAEPDAKQVQLSLRQEQQDFAINHDQFRVQNIVPAGDIITIPWKPTAVAECGTNSEHCTTATIVSVDKMSTASIVLQNAQEDFSVISEDSTTIQEEALPIDAVIETIEEYVGNDTRSDPNGQPNEAKKEIIGDNVQPNADWNFDVNMAFDMHMKKHSGNVIDEVGQNKSLVTNSVQGGKFTVTSKGLAPPLQPGVSLIRNITTPVGTVGRYQDTQGILRSDANQWESQDLQFSLNSDPTNVLKVQYTKNEIPTVLQKSCVDIHSGFKEQNIQPILNAQPMEQPLHIQNEMYRLGLHVQIDIPDNDNVKIVNPSQTFIVPEDNTVASSSTEVGNIMVQSTSKDLFWTTEEQKKLSTGKEVENSGLSSNKNITASTPVEENVPATLSMVPREYVRTDLGKLSGATNASDTPHKVFSGTGSLAVGHLETTPVPVSVTGTNMEKTSSVDTGNNQVRREIARIVILPNKVESNDQTKRIVKEVGCKSPMKKALLIPIQNISREKSNKTSEPAGPSVLSTDNGTSESTCMSVDQQVTLNKEERPTMTLKPLSNAMIECELNVLQRPKKITRYFKEKAKNQETKQKDIQPHEAKEGDTPKEVSSEKDTKPFALDDPNPSPVILLRNSAGGPEVKGPKPFICHECGRGFSHLGDYNSHVKAHKDGMPFTCKECGVGFRKSGHLINHSRRHTGEKPFACTRCDNTFGQLGTLKRHMRIHTGEKPYECPTCKKSFSQLSYMKVHRRSHTGERPFKCEVCEHSFLQSGDLKKHMLRKHNTKKELSCPHCTKRFGDKVDIKRHIKTHEGKLGCKICDEMFPDVESAKVHKQMFHSKEKVKELSHRCVMCDIGFKLKADLQSHKRDCHPPDKKAKPKGRGKGKKRGRKRGKQTPRSDEDTDSDYEEDRSDLQDIKPTITVKEEAIDASDEQKEGEGDKQETVVRGTRKRKASKFQPRKLLPPVKQDRPKRTRRSVE